MRGLLNLSVDRINSSGAFRIALLKEFSLFSIPNKRVLTILSSFSVKILESIVAILSKIEFLILEDKTSTDRQKSLTIPIL